MRGIFIKNKGEREGEREREKERGQVILILLVAYMKFLGTN